MEREEKGGGGKGGGEEGRSDYRAVRAVRGREMEERRGKVGCGKMMAGEGWVGWGWLVGFVYCYGWRCGGVLIFV